MVTRREKIKRSVCKVQEQIFSLYTKLLEQERVSGMHLSPRRAKYRAGVCSLNTAIEGKQLLFHLSCRKFK